MVECGAGFEHATVTADAVSQVLGRLGLLISVGNLVAVVDGGDDIAVLNQVILHLGDVPGESFHLLHTLAAFAGGHGNGGKGSVAFRFADDDGNVDFVASQDERVVTGNGTLEGLAGDDVSMGFGRFCGRVAGAELFPSHDGDMGKRHGGNEHSGETYD